MPELEEIDESELITAQQLITEQSEPIDRKPFSGINVIEEVIINHMC